MSLKIRPASFTLYRITFVALMFAIGIICLGTMLLETYTEIRIIDLEPGIDYDAILATSGVAGFLGLASGCMMYLLMLDRRTVRKDRRQHQQDIGFPDRRTRPDRRSGE